MKQYRMLLLRWLKSKLCQWFDLAPKEQVEHLQNRLHTNDTVWKSLQHELLEGRNVTLIPGVRNFNIRIYGNTRGNVREVDEFASMYADSFEIQEAIAGLSRFYEGGPRYVNQPSQKTKAS